MAKRPQFDDTTLLAALRDLPREQFRKRLRVELVEKGSSSGIRPGLRSVTVYLISPWAPELMEFVKQAFGAEETFRAMGSAGGMHAEARIGDCMLMIGGGYEYKGESRTAASHLYVPDVDATYQRALALGAASLSEPADMSYGERGAGVKDLAGNSWYLAAGFGDQYVQEGCDALMPYFHARGADELVGFIQRAFGGTPMDRHANPDGTVAQARVRLGTSVLELSDAGGPINRCQPLSTCPLPTLTQPTSVPSMQGQRR